MEKMHPHSFYDYLDSTWAKEIHEQYKGPEYWFYSGSDNDFQLDEINQQLVEQKYKSLLPSIGDPFKFLAWFFDKGTDLFIDYFKVAPSIKFGHSSRVVDKTITRYTISISHSKTKNLRLEIIDFGEEVNELLNLETSKIKRLLTTQFDQNLDAALFTTYLLNCKTKIENFKSVGLVQTKAHADCFQESLANLKEELIKFIHTLLEKSDSSDVELDGNRIPKERIKELLSRIYNMPVGSGMFIDHTKTDFEKFQNFFSKNATPEDNIHIYCKNNEAAVILNCMKRFNLPIVYSEYHKNKSIKTINSKHLTESYINKVNSIKEKEPPLNLHQINFFFHELEREFFYNK